MGVKDWSTTAGSNTAVGGINIAELCDPGNLNNAMREMMAEISAVIGASGIGYILGQGGTVTQATSKSTTVTLNKLTGQITLHNQSMASGAQAAFNFFNSTIGDHDIVLVQIAGPLLSGVTNYDVKVGEITAGGCSIAIKNVSGGTLAESPVLNFIVLKGTTA